ncbi:MAG: carboxymuconolactone decarboxylase family protein [Albidovulum sp.]
MNADSAHIDTYAKGKALSEAVNPGMEDALRARYEALVPGLAETVVDVAYGKFYARQGVDEKTRLLATIAALTALGGQTRPQLKVNIASARAVGASREEISEIIFQMTLYGGFPAMINALNAAIEVFDSEEEAA